MTKKYFFIFFIFFLTTSVFSETIPYIIESFYNDWNFIALNATVEKQEEYWKAISNTKNILKMKIDDISQKDVLIIRSMINIVKIIGRSEKSPIRNTYLFVTSIQQKNGKYEINIKKMNIVSNKTESSEILDPRNIDENNVKMNIIGQSMNIWEYLDDGYTFRIALGHLILQE